MGYKSTWKGFYKEKNRLIGEILNQTHHLKFESYTETEKAWIVKIKENTYTFPKSKTVLFKETNTIDIPHWLYVRNTVEDDTKKF